MTNDTAAPTPFAPFTPLPPEQQTPAKAAPRRRGASKKTAAEPRRRASTPKPAKPAVSAVASLTGTALQNLLAAASSLPPEDIELFSDWFERFSKLEVGQRGRLYAALEKVFG